MTKKRKKDPIKALTFNQIRLFALIRIDSTTDVEELLQTAKDIKLNSTMSNTGLLPLHTAVYWGHNRMVIVLLKLGANSEVRNYVGETALDIAKEKGYKHIIYILRNFKNDYKKEESNYAVGLR